MPTSPILILGAGAAGLMAARTLALAGMQVRVIEARERIGGRVHTVPMADGQGVLELGAEFIHGRLPLTLKLVEEVGLTIVPVVFDSFEPGPKGLQDSEQQQSNEDEDPIALVFSRMDRLQGEDMTFEEFLTRHVPEPELEWARQAARRYVQGFDAADPARISVQALRRENAAEDLHQFRIAQGYSKLMDHLAQTDGVQIFTGQVVERVVWEQGSVRLEGRDGQDLPFSHTGRAAILTLPLGIWQAGTIAFVPALPEKEAAIRDLGFGPALKVIVEGKTRFWQSETEQGGFIFTQHSPFEVWWTADKLPYPLLTAWAGGPPAKAMESISDKKLENDTLDELASMLAIPVNEVRNQIAQVHITHWGTDPFALGAYSWELANKPDARARLAAPVADTLFFAGEATYQGDHPGTVEAALESGKRAAVEVLAAFV